MPAPTPAGRHRLYGDRHLDRLRRIKELQERRFSLAAIRAIVETNRPGIDDLFSGSGRTYTLAELVERSGVDADLVERLRGVDLLPDPAEFGRDAYDDTDLHLLEAIAELQQIGMPDRGARRARRDLRAQLPGAAARGHRHVRRAHPPRLGPGDGAGGAGTAERERGPAHTCGRPRPELRAPAHAATLHARRDPRRAGQRRRGRPRPVTGSRYASRCRRRSWPSRRRGSSPSSLRSPCASTASRCRGAGSRKTTSCCRRRHGDAGRCPSGR